MVNTGTPTDSRPWLQRSEWTDNRISAGKPGKTFQVKTGWAIAVVWNLAAVAWLLLSWMYGNSEALGGGVVSGFIGLSILLWVVAATLDLRRFGDECLVLDPFPGSIGGHFGASLALPVAYRPGQFVETRLRCIRWENFGDDDANAIERWQTVGMADIQSCSNGIALSCRFEVPSNLPESGPVVGHRGNEYVWRLELRGMTPDLKFTRILVVPMFATSQQSAFLHVDALEHPVMKKWHAQEVLRVCTIEPIPGGMQLYFSAAQRWPWSLGMAAFGVLFAGVGWLFGYIEAPLELTIVLCGAGGLITLWGLYALSNTLRVQIDHQGVRTERRILGLLVARHQVVAAQIAGLRLKQGSTRRSGITNLRRSGITNFSVVAQLRSGQRVTLAAKICGQAAAEYLRVRLCEAAGYDKRVFWGHENS